MPRFVHCRQWLGGDNKPTTFIINPEQIAFMVNTDGNGPAMIVMVNGKELSVEPEDFTKLIHATQQHVSTGGIRE